MELVFPIMLKSLLEWIADENSEISTGYFYAIILTIALTLKGYMNVLGTNFNDYSNGRMRSAVKVKKNNFLNLRPI